MVFDRENIMRVCPGWGGGFDAKVLAKDGEVLAKSWQSLGMILAHFCALLIGRRECGLCARLIY